MKNSHMGLFSFIYTLLCVVLFVHIGALGAYAEEGGFDTSMRKIVVFQKHISHADQTKIITRAKGVRIKQLYSKNIALVEIGSDDVFTLTKSPGVVRVEDDARIEVFKISDDTVKKANSKEFLFEELITWGMRHIHASRGWDSEKTTEEISVGIMDTGVSVKHPDLALRVKGGVSEVAYTSSFNDDNGHGSHVAGVIGAMKNKIGVIGVAPNVSLYAIKVLDEKGLGFVSDLVNGIDWAIEKDIKVINISLGLSEDIRSLYDAINRAHRAGIVVIAAAGNSGGQVMYPAAYPTVVAVSAVDFFHNVPYWSARGPEIDITAPGVAIYSTFIGNRYKTMSGTSMAASFVSGVAALTLTFDVDTKKDIAKGTCIALYDSNCDGVWNPDEVVRKLKAGAIDLGIAGPDDMYGAGLLQL